MKQTYLKTKEALKHPKKWIKKETKLELRNQKKEGRTEEENWTFRAMKRQTSQGPGRRHWGKAKLMKGKRRGRRRRNTSSHRNSDWKLYWKIGHHVPLRFFLVSSTCFWPLPVLSSLIFLTLRITAAPEAKALAYHPP